MRDYIIKGIPADLLKISALEIIDSEKLNIIEGIYYETFYKGAITTLTSKYFGFTTPLDKNIVYIPSDVATSVDNLTIRVYEGATITADTGTLLSVFNHNRITTLTNNIGMLESPTITDNGTQIAEAWLSGAVGVGQRRSGGATSSENAWILKKDTSYAVELYNGSTETNNILIKNHWYEVSDVYDF